MGTQRALCPYCEKLSKVMYNPIVNKKRDKVQCENCGKTYFVVYGEGIVKSEKTLKKHL